MARRAAISGLPSTVAIMAVARDLLGVVQGGLKISSDGVGYYVGFSKGYFSQPSAELQCRAFLQCPMPTCGSS